MLVCVKMPRKRHSRARQRERQETKFCGRGGTGHASRCRGQAVSRLTRVMPAGSRWHALPGQDVDVTFRMDGVCRLMPGCHELGFLGKVVKVVTTLRAMSIAARPLIPVTAQSVNVTIILLIPGRREDTTLAKTPSSCHPGHLFP